MKSLLSVLIFISFLFNVNAQTDNRIVIGTIDSVYSKVLNEQRKIWVYVPDDFNSGLFSKQHYPVVYLLDGDAHFLSVVGMIQQLSTVNGNNICPQMIVVGIPNTDRTRDLTPSHIEASPFGGGNFDQTSGGSELFTNFIENELMPHIDSLYPTTSYRVLIGHSLGGLMVINTLIHHTDLFNTYIAIDPSMWWDDQKLLKASENILESRNFEKTTLYLAVANTMEDGMDIAKVKKDTTRNTLHIRSILELNNVLRKNKQNKLNYEYKYYGNDDHGSVPLIAEYDALHFIFDFYPMKLTMSDFQDTTAAMAVKIEKHWGEVSKKMGYKLMPPESMLNDFGYQSLNTNQYSKALQFFKLNITYYPESFNVYDSLGDYYDARADKENAIAQYKKALELREFPETRMKLEKLEGMKSTQKNISD
jgi:predicted alpha/beta superfamily hydrolase